LETLEVRLPPGDLFNANWALGDVAPQFEQEPESVCVAGKMDVQGEESADSVSESVQDSVVPPSRQGEGNAWFGMAGPNGPYTQGDEGFLDLDENWLAEDLLATFPATPPAASSGYGTRSLPGHPDATPNGDNPGVANAPPPPISFSPMQMGPLTAPSEGRSVDLPGSLLMPLIPSSLPVPASATTAANQQVPLTNDGHGATVLNQLVFQLQTGQEANLGTLQSLAQTYHLDLLPTGLPGLYQLNGTATELAAIQPILAAQPAVRYVEAPEIVHATDTDPNDPQFLNGTTWGLNGTNGIRAPQAWDFTTGSPATVIAIVDTGIDYNHPDLYENVWINQKEIPPSRLKNLTDVDGDGILSFWDLNNPVNQGPGKITDVNGDGRIDGGDLLAPLQKDASGNDTGLGGWADGISEDGDTAHVDDLVGWNFVKNNNNPFDDNSHGTHVAGTIAAIGNNGVGVAGVDWKASLMALKFLDASGSGSDVGAAAAIAYSIQHGARISNNSWSGGNSTTLFNAVQATSTADFGGGRIGQIFVAAAGNGGQNTDVNPSYPAAYNRPNVLSVAAINTDGNLAAFSNFGPNTVKLAAPGVNVYSTTPNNGYAFKSGTSMATPHATGLAGLMLSQDPNLTAAQVVSRIVSTTTPDPVLTGKILSGGILNAAAALATAPPAAPTNLTASTGGPGLITLSWSDVAGASGFKIERSPNGSSDWIQVGTTNAHQTVWQNGALPVGTTFFYRVRATNLAGSSPSSNVANGVSGTGGAVAAFTDGFDSTSIASGWSFKNGTWVQADGVLSQTSTASADPRKALATGAAFSTNQQIIAKVRVDSWIDGDYARAGVGLRTDPTTGQGYNLVFHYAGGTRNNVQFLNDGVVWGNRYSFNWTVGTWYWFKLTTVNGVLYGKVWPDGTPEPSAWAFTQSGWSARTSGVPALNGGAALNGGTATVSFDDVSVQDPAVNVPSPPAAPTGLTATAASSSQINLSWNDVSNETTFKIERSPDGISGWTQIGTTAAGVTTFVDQGLAAETTYFYRVRGTNAAGDGAYSAVVSATTPSAPPLFTDDFSSSTIGPAWSFSGGSWTQGNGTLRQTSTADADPRKAMLTDQTYPANVQIQAKVRVDSWIDGDFARAGVGLATDASTGHGFNLVFHSTGGTKNNVQFLDDGIQWGAPQSFNWNVGTWYWFKMARKDGVLYGKIWQDGTTEPTAWQFVQKGWTYRASGVPALNGGSAKSASDGSTATVSFANVTVRPA
jgi:subtilisin family serine protease